MRTEQTRCVRPMRSDDKAPTRVCCLCERWASGGIESFLCNVLMHLDMSELEVDVVAAQLGDSVFTERLTMRGVRFYELSGSARRVGEDHRLFRALLRKRHYDVLHLNTFQSLSLAYLRIAKEEDVPVRIAHSHNTALRKCATRPIKLAIHRWAKERYTKDATALWACSKNAAEFLFSTRALDEKGYQFIPDGIDVERFQFVPAVREDMRHELGLNGKYVIGSVGRLCYQKNQSFLLEVLAEVVKERPESILLLVGEGGDRPMLEEKARRLGIADRVLFYGTCECVERLYCAMDVFAFSSRFEGFGIAALEAQCSGLPTVCSEGVPLELDVTPLFYRACVSEGAERWAASILSVAKHTTERMDHAYRICKSGYDIPTVAKWIGSKYCS